MGEVGAAWGTLIAFAFMLAVTTQVLRPPNKRGQSPF